MIPAIDAAAVRTALVAERTRLLAELGEPIEGPGQMTYGSQAAAATHVFEQQRDLAMRDHAKVQLGHVDLALAAMDSGSYGACRNCGKPIAPERLAAIPWVELCIECARKSTR